MRAADFALPKVRKSSHRDIRMSTPVPMNGIKCGPQAKPPAIGLSSMRDVAKSSEIPSVWSRASLAVMSPLPRWCQGTMAGWAGCWRRWRFNRVTIEGELAIANNGPANGTECTPLSPLVESNSARGGRQYSGLKPEKASSPRCQGSLCSRVGVGGWTSSLTDLALWGRRTVGQGWMEMLTDWFPSRQPDREGGIVVSGVTGGERATKGLPDPSGVASWCKNMIDQAMYPTLCDLAVICDELS